MKAPTATDAATLPAPLADPVVVLNAALGDLEHATRQRHAAHAVLLRELQQLPSADRAVTAVNRMMNAADRAALASVDALHVVASWVQHVTTVPKA